MDEEYQDPSQLLNTAQAAHFLGLHKCTLDRWRAQEKGPAYHPIGRHIRYSVGDLRLWKAQQRRIPGERGSHDDGPLRHSTALKDAGGPTDAKAAQQPPSNDSPRSR
ncbi:MAG: helix-turn-helix transcriptional regulator [Caulobacterales bacterium]